MTDATPRPWTVSAEDGMTCEVELEYGLCGLPAAVCDLNGPDDPTQGPSFFCKEHQPKEASK